MADRVTNRPDECLLLCQRHHKLTYKWKNMMDMLWLFSTNNASPNNYEYGSQSTSPSVPRSPSDVTCEPKL